MPGSTQLHKGFRFQFLLRKYRITPPDTWTSSSRTESRAWSIVFKWASLIFPAWCWELATSACWWPHTNWSTWPNEPHYPLVVNGLDSLLFPSWESFLENVVGTDLPGRKSAVLTWQENIPPTCNYFQTCYLWAFKQPLQSKAGDGKWGIRASFLV